MNYSAKLKEFDKNAEFKENWGKFNFNAIFGIILGILITACVLNIYDNSNVIYSVSVNGKNVGYIKEIQEYKKAIEEIKKTDGIDTSKMITVEKAQLLQNVAYIDSNVIERAARSQLNLKMPAAVIYANGVEVVKVQNKDEAEKVIEKLKQSYYSSIKSGTFTILSTKISDKIEIVPTLASSEEILTVDEAVRKIAAGRGDNKVYTVAKGDTIWDISLKNDISIEEIKRANPNLNLDKIQIGQKINFAVNVPYLKVEIVANVTTREKLPYDSKKVTDKKMAKGASKIKQKGKNGIAQIEKKVVIVNGQVIEEEVERSKTLIAPVEEIVAIGTKVPMYVASGTFIKPSRGIYTSRFGRRWGEFHTGLDIAGPTGTPILAADSGKVTFAGWRNGYGKCVMITHGNGYQTLYGHASRIYVKAGQRVNKGQKIAAIGSTGRSTGPHLHFEVRKNGVPQNPQKYIR
ncbi:peptidase M23 [Fervidicella metallireducens AeB]|uniref:Peptidase M23 n=1 Tax=Fervidicella metallireducens AeB TaxID=1403537 RepID=A0A017RU40_9CLOT|nr:M23 family metallopeptidase [Fervidicella metallireducens]EYE87415.1 peptidase M23 [Fervidicella metallireducens AeB]